MLEIALILCYVNLLKVKNEAAALCEEASMPLEKVLERYGSQVNAGSVMGKSIYSLRKRQKFQSPLVRTKADKSDGKEKPCECFPSEADGTELPSASPASSTGNKEFDEVKTKLEDKLINGFYENEADRCQSEVTNGSSGAVTSGISVENEDLPVSKGKEADMNEISDVTSTSDAKPKVEENGDNKAGPGSSQKMTSEPHGPVVISSSSKMPSSNNKEVVISMAFSYSQCIYNKLNRCLVNFRLFQCPVFSFLRCRKKIFVYALDTVPTVQCYFILVSEARFRTEIDKRVLLCGICIFGISVAYAELQSLISHLWSGVCGCVSVVLIDR